MWPAPFIRQLRPSEDDYQVPATQPPDDADVVVGVQAREVDPSLARVIEYVLPLGESAVTV